MTKIPTKYDQITESVRQAYIHQHSMRVTAKRAILLFEAEKIDEEIVGLTSALSNARERRAKISAMVAGLSDVLGARE